MAGRRPEDSRLSDAFRVAYETAGVSQVQIADACGVDQPTVSKWARGVLHPPLWALPTIDALCGKPKGHVLRLAGYVEDGQVDILAAIEHDPLVTDPVDRECLRMAYRLFRTRPAEEQPEVVQPEVVERSEPATLEGAAASHASNLRRIEALEAAAKAAAEDASVGRKRRRKTG